MRKGGRKRGAGLGGYLVRGNWSESTKKKKAERKKAHALAIDGLLQRQETRAFFLPNLGMRIR